MAEKLETRSELFTSINDNGEKYGIAVSNIDDLNNKGIIEFIIHQYSNLNAKFVFNIDKNGDLNITLMKQSNAGSWNTYYSSKFKKA